MLFTSHLSPFFTAPLPACFTAQPLPACCPQLTLFLATSALLYVIGATVPKTSYLTAIDKLVIIVLLVQFSIAACSMIAFFLRPPYDLAFDIASGCLLLLLLLGSFTTFFALPMLRAARVDRKAWPSTLQRATGVSYHSFENGVNVFPPAAPGPPPPWALPKTDVTLDDDRAPLLPPHGAATMPMMGSQPMRSSLFSMKPRRSDGEVSSCGGFRRLEDEPADMAV